MTGVLVMAYGGPDRLEDVEPYVLDVRDHRPTPPALIEEIRARYRAIGGRSPILERTRAQAAALERSLIASGTPARTYVGMRHWRPTIPDALAHMRAEGIRRVVGLVMAPHFSAMSVGAYYRKVGCALEDMELRRILTWHLLPGYLDAVTARVHAAAAVLEPDARAGDSVHVLFTAHSLPARIVADGDPYAAQLRETVDALANRIGLPHSFAYQSAAMTPEPWLGPDAAEALTALASSGVRRVVVAPIGFTSDHVEILYDIDIALQAHARTLGMTMRRIAMMNDDPAMMAGLAGLVRAEMANAGWM